jgi:hypothetical protein
MSHFTTYVITKTTTENHVADGSIPQFLTRRRNERRNKGSVLHRHILAFMLFYIFSFWYLCNC